MSDCPFCKSPVHDGASVCRSCGAEKVRTVQRHLKLQERKVGVATKFCGFLGGFIGLLVGLSIKSFAIGISIFVIGLFLPLLFFCILNRNKTLWYR